LKVEMRQDKMDGNGSQQNLIDGCDSEIPLRGRIAAMLASGPER
jgi:hypothetical protein